MLVTRVNDKNWRGTLHNCVANLSLTSACHCCPGFRFLASPFPYSVLRVFHSTPTMQLASCTSRLNGFSVGVVVSFIFWHKNGGTSHGSCYGLRRTAVEERLCAEAFVRMSDAEGWRWSEQVFSDVPSSPLSGTAPSILIILRLRFSVIFVLNNLIPPIIPIL